MGKALGEGAGGGRPGRGRRAAAAGGAGGERAEPRPLVTSEEPWSSPTLVSSRRSHDEAPAGSVPVSCSGGQVQGGKDPGRRGRCPRGGSSSSGPEACPRGGGPSCAERGATPGGSGSRPTAPGRPAAHSAPSARGAETRTTPAAGAGTATRAGWRGEEAPAAGARTLQAGPGRSRSPAAGEQRGLSPRRPAGRAETSPGHPAPPPARPPSRGSDWLGLSGGPPRGSLGNVVPCAAAQAPWAGGGPGGRAGAQTLLHCAPGRRGDGEKQKRWVPSPPSRQAPVPGLCPLCPPPASGPLLRPRGSYRALGTGSCPRGEAGARLR